MTHLSILYISAVTLLFFLNLEAFWRKSEVAWRIPALFVYMTTAVWYLFEVIYFPEQVGKFQPVIVNSSYIQVIIFLIAFRLLVAPLCYAFTPFAETQLDNTAFQPEKILQYIFVLWICLLAYGTFRMDGDIVRALFPLNARNGAQMWIRAAAAGAGPTGFIVSTASYLYMLVCAFFGILLSLQTKGKAKFINLLLFLIVLPYYIFMGSRNQLLAVVMPGYFHFAIFSRQGLWKKIIFTLITFLILNYIMTLIITFRNVGFAGYFDSLEQGTLVVSEHKHDGFNIMEELCYINVFLRTGALKLDGGWRYLAEFLNFVPRAIWPNKPLLGIDYAILRGFGSSSSDTGVFATLSTGFIGQGVMSFGPLIGPLAPGLLLALWSAFLSRLLRQSQSVLRRCLFLVGLGLTFNLGRDITLLVLWPMVFGYIVVRLLENRQRSKNLTQSILVSGKVNVLGRSSI